MSETGNKCSVSVDLNAHATHLIQQGSPAIALQSLKDSLAQLRELPPNASTLKLTATTLNNIGCAYKYTHQPALALKYFREACKIETSLTRDPASIANACTNLGVAYSDAGQHLKALYMAVKAVKALEAGRRATPATITSYVIAAHNVGVEYEHLGQTRQAREYYNKALDAARECLGEAHELTQAVLNSMLELEPTVQFTVVHRRKSPKKARRQRRRPPSQPVVNPFELSGMRATVKSCIYSGDRTRASLNRTLNGTLNGKLNNTRNNTRNTSLNRLSGKSPRPSTAVNRVVISSKQFGK